MNPPPQETAWVRLGLGIGLLMALAAGSWWLAATPRDGSPPGAAAPVAGQALAGLWLLRAVWIAPFALRTAALLGTRGGFLAALAVQMPAWPLLAAAAQAAVGPPSRVLLGEALLAAGALGLALGGDGLRRTLRAPAARSALATLLGLAAAAAVWAWGSPWPGASP